jgi:hypothetical protein
MTVVVTWLELEASNNLNSSRTVTATGSSTGTLRITGSSSRTITVSRSSTGTVRINGSSTRTISVTGSATINTSGATVGTSNKTITLIASSRANIYFNASLRRYLSPSRDSEFSPVSRTYTYTTSDRIGT